jgi:hypothetical protein
VSDAGLKSGDARATQNATLNSSRPAIPGIYVTRNGHVGVIILAVTRHQLPKMMAEMVTEGGYSGHFAGVGVTTVLDAAVAGSSIARAVAAGGTDSAGRRNSTVIGR